MFAHQRLGRAARRTGALITLCAIALPCFLAAAHETGPDGAPLAKSQPGLIEGWATETFSLPPGFAPDLPAGVESLRFAPGWRDPSSESFWSYAFVMWIDEPAPDAERIDELLETYYSGLMSVFAGNRGEDISSDPVRVVVERTAPDRFEAQMHLIDAFATFKPVDLRVVIDTVAEADDRSAVGVRVSLQPEAHKIWRSLDAAVESIRSHAALLEKLRMRADYAGLDQQAVGSLAQAAETRWPEAFSGFTLQRVERFSAGGVSHWMSVWLHGRTGLEFVLVPGGGFQMGSPADEAGRREDEAPHRVNLDPFLVARTECTREAWARIAGSAEAEEAGLRGGAFEGPGQLPISGFSPAEVDTWCGLAGLMLPTEAQWEYMCRAGTASPWTMGVDKTDLVRFANVGSAECPESWIRMGLTEPWHDGYAVEPAAVGTFGTNAFGLFDVHGNLNEWVRDRYESYEVPVQAGTGLRAGASDDRIARGGNGGGTAEHARSAYRLNVGTGVSPGGNKGFGFRPSFDLSF